MNDNKSVTAGRKDGKYNAWALDDWCIRTHGGPHRGAVGEPIEMTVMFDVGSASDITARQLVGGMAKHLSAPVPVVNHTGGSALGYVHGCQEVRPLPAFRPGGYAHLGEPPHGS